MSYDVDAVYDGEVFRPVVPLALPEGTRVHLHIVGDIDNADRTPQQRAGLDEFRRIMATLPLESATDGFCGADHDDVLYGQP